MQFTYPDLLWALFLLLIPIIIHLFRLRRFKKTPFTNVRLLKKVVAETRRSQRLKKWLLLFTRLILIAAVVLAFAQPFTAGPTALQTRQNIIYLDNSFSMQARTAEGSLLESAVQQLLRAIPEEQQFSLFTNNRVFSNVHGRDIRNELLALPFTGEQLDMEAILLKGATLFDEGEPGTRNLIVISDFQERMAVSPTDSLTGIRKHLVRLQAESPVNASVDTAYISDSNANTLELTALLSRSGLMDDIPVSLFNADTLIAKTSAIWDQDNKAEVLFTIPAGERLDGRITITDNELDYDNRLYFNIAEKERIKVLSVGNTADNFLDRIFTAPEFDFLSVAYENLNYSSIPNQNLIILNELPSIPEALQNALGAFVEEGGSLVCIPASSPELDSYNRLLTLFNAGSYKDKVQETRAITGISFSHPLFENVFEEEVTNFQYPEVTEYLPFNSSLGKILSLQGGEAFLSGNRDVYVFTAPLSAASSNFRNSPLIVPVFYNIGAGSLKRPEIYYQTGRRAEVDVPVSLGQDRILKVRQQDYEFIPLQRSYANKTALIFEDLPLTDGHFMVSENGTRLKGLSFNYDRAESDLKYADPENLRADTIYTAIGGLFESLEKEGSITAFWKWFVILALLCMLAELLIQKFLK